MVTKLVEVRQRIRVTVDETKFTDEWMGEFRKVMYPFYTINDHLEHLAQLYARGIYDNHSFIEGYGKAKDLGIKFYDTRDGEQEVLQDAA